MEVTKVSEHEMQKHLNHRGQGARSPVLNQGPQSRDALKYDAYAAFSDEEEAWSTLPARKKPQKKVSSGSLKQSGRFRLPLTLDNLSSTNSGTADSSTGSQAARKRKVTTYLPPPKRRRSNSEPPLQATRQHSSNSNPPSVASKLGDALDSGSRSVAKWSIKRLNGKFAYRGPNLEEAQRTVSQEHHQPSETRKLDAPYDNYGKNVEDLAQSDQFSATNSDPCIPCDEHRILHSYSQVRRAIADVSDISKFSRESQLMNVLSGSSGRPQVDKFGISSTAELRCGLYGRGAISSL